MPWPLPTQFVSVVQLSPYQEPELTHVNLNLFTIDDFEEDNLFLLWLLNNSSPGRADKATGCEELLERHYFQNLKTKRQFNFFKNQHHLKRQVGQDQFHHLLRKIIHPEVKYLWALLQKDRGTSE